jgi:hypothetical protein
MLALNQLGMSQKSGNGCKQLNLIDDSQEWYIVCGHSYPDQTCMLWLCLSCVRKTSDNTENLM